MEIRKDDLSGQAIIAWYRRHGFVECGPFADYRPDPNSVFMVKKLAAS